MSAKDLPDDRAVELVASSLRFAVHGLSADAAATFAGFVVRSAREERDREAELRRDRRMWREESRRWRDHDRKPASEPPRPPSPHDILGVRADATAAEIAAAYRAAARRAHPDAGGSHEAMAAVNAARAAMLRERQAA